MAVPAQISVLHVDDDDNERRSLAYLLRAEGFAVQLAATGAEAMRLAADTPDVVILDVGLPDFSGFEVCRRLKAEQATASIRVLQLSGHFTCSKVRIQGLAVGADAYLTKPVDPLEVIAQVRARRGFAMPKKSSVACSSPLRTPW